MKDKNKKTKKRLKPTVKVVVCYIMSFALAIVGLNLVNTGKTILKSETPKVDYTLKGKVDYKVNLKENKYYEEEYLRSGMQYIASLIKSVDIDFIYEAQATDKIDYKSTYKVDAVTVVNSKGNSGKKLYEKSDIINQGKTVEIQDKNLAINDVISIDYEKYNNYILGYKKDYLLNGTFDLIVKIHVETTGESEKVQDKFKETKEFEVVIPLSEQIIDIKLKGADYQISSNIEGTKIKTETIQKYYYSSVACFGASFILVIIAVMINAIKNKKKSKYRKVVEKYLKEYDRAIVLTNKTRIIEEKYDREIKITSMQEMLDLHDNLGMPILYYEDKEKEESYFEIIKDNILYAFVITKKEFEENSKKN